MKMVKSLLLGSAAGIVAVAGAQAADLPVKAKPVEYVKICSLYGAGYWYLPGTDTCFKLGARMTAGFSYGDTIADGSAPGIATPAGQIRHDRAETNPLAGLQWRAQATFDFRTASQYGVVRAYFNMGWQQRMPQDTAIYAGPAFVQFMGFTVGRTPGGFGLVNGSLYGYAPQRNNPEPAIVSGIEAITYTGQLGGGFSYTISLEDGGFNSANYGESVANFFGPPPGGLGRGRPVQSITLNNPFAGATAVGAFPSGVAGVNANPQGSIGSVLNTSGPNNMFDIVGNIRYDSPAFTAQIMGALHQITADYYTLGVNGVSQNFAGSPGCGGANANSPPGPGLVCNYFGHPDDEWGFAIGAGVIVKNFLGWQGDELAIEARYGEGAVGYYSGAAPGAFYRSNSVGIFTAANDAFFGSTSAFSGTQLNKTSGWSAALIWQHYWTPTLRQSLQTGANAFNYGSTNKALICGGNGAFGAGNVAAVAGLVQNQSTASLVAGGAPAGTVFNCNPDWSTFSIGTRLEWLPMPLLRIGTEYWWTHFNTAFKGYANLAAAGARPAGTYKIDDQDGQEISVYIRKELLYP
jgi:hypothetical protein